jgi:hypothetical protein
VKIWQEVVKFIKRLLDFSQHIGKKYLRNVVIEGIGLSAAVKLGSLEKPVGASLIAL